MDKKQELIAQESLRFLAEDTRVCEFPCAMASLPFPKGEIREAIKTYVGQSLEKSLLSDQQLAGIRVAGTPNLRH